MGLALGRPLMPWQQYVSDVATERLPDPSSCYACARDLDPSAVPSQAVHTCPYAYQVVVVSVPRQSGKTLLIMVILMVRCVMYAHHQALYTAQTGKDARARWQDLVKLVTGSPLRSQVRVRRSQGSERLEFPNGSMLGVFAPTSDSLHGYTPPTVVLDEAFAHTEDEGADLLAAIEPAQQTLPHRQLWLVSTRGTAASSFFHAWIERGCAGSPGVAVFDWGARDDQDPRDPQDLVAFHPALGLPPGQGNGTTAEGILASKLPPSEYERAYANRETVTESHTISAAAWAALANPQAPPGDAPLVLTYDVAYDRSSATIGVTWRDSDGKLQHKLVRWQLGVSWVADDVAQLARRWGRRVTAVASDDTGPARDVTDQLRRMAHPVPQVARDPRVLTTRELTVAWGELLAAVQAGPDGATFGHDGDGHLTDAAAAVVPRPVLDSAAPSRRYSPGDIAPLVALMVGLYVAQHQRPTDQTPRGAFA
jgi:hypothetical protein